MGNVLQQKGKLDEAIESAKKATFSIVMMLVLIITWQRFSRSKACDEVIKCYKKRSIKPDYAEAYNNMGTTLQEQGKLEEAVEAYAKAIAIKPNYAGAYNNMGTTLQEQGIQKRR